MLLLLLAGFPVPDVAAQGAPAKLQFSLDRPGSPPVQYTLIVADTGEGQYTPAAMAGGPTGPAPAGAEGPAKFLRVDPALVKTLFAAVPMVEGGRCETHSKNIAKTGVKVLHYTGNGRDAQCTYNYSDDDRVNDATSAFEGLAETLQFGDRLRSKLRFDRLGLDSELDLLQTAITEHRALGIANIAPVLKSIASDERVMDRARHRAEQLLVQGGASLPVQAPDAAAVPAASSDR